MVLHYAGLAVASGGIDGFILGSELRGLTQLRDETGAFPFVQELVGLTADVRAIVGPHTKLTYGADWSEYFGYHPQDGSGEVHFHLDPLWASADIDAVGIDNYMPLGDWRDEDLSADNPDGFRVADDAHAMAAQIAAGEGFDWYYASEADQRSRVRSPISDGLAGKPWVYRYKDLTGWWSNRHFDRTGGAENTTPTAWVPGMKPIWFTELGCPAVDKGANQPNVFIDPKSAESALPHFSSGGRSDSMQRRFLEAHHGWWHGKAPPEGMVDSTPVDMVDPDHIFVWTWDARPVPAFPGDLSAWSDGGNWRTGHWLNGRLGGTTLADAIAAILAEHGFEDFDVSEVSGDLTGYVQGDVTSARALLEPLLEVFQVDVAEDGGRLRFRSRLKAGLAAKEITVVADIEDEPLWSENRGHDSDFAAEAVLTSYNPGLDYEQSGARSRRARAESQRILSYDLPAVLPEETSLAAVETLLRSHRVARRSLSFALSPADISVEPGMRCSWPCRTLPVRRGPSSSSGSKRGRATRRGAASRAACTVELCRRRGRRNGGSAVSDAFAPVLHFLDLPRFAPGEAASLARLAGFCRPWRRMALSSSVTMEGYRTRSVLDRPARVGVLTAPLVGSVAGRFDRASLLEIELFFGGLSSADEQAVLNGENRIAVKAQNGVWEVIGFAGAEEISPNRWLLSNLLRGLAGTEDAMLAGAAAGAAVIVLDEAVVPLGLSADERGLAMNWLAESLGQAGGRSGPHGFAGGMRAETPLSPVHIRGERQVAGDTRLIWVRRGRVEADNWDGTDIPLDEPEERYRIELLDGAIVRRRVEVTEPVFTYAAADEIADFGRPQSSLSLRIRQMGRAVPLGLPAETIVIF